MVELGATASRNGRLLLRPPPTTLALSAATWLGAATSTFNADDLGEPTGVTAAWRQHRRIRRLSRRQTLPRW